MKLSQDLRNEINCNLRLQAELLEVINNAKANRNSVEIDNSCLDILRLKLLTGEYVYEDLVYYVATILFKNVITTNDGIVVKKAILSVNKDAFFSDSEELQILIMSVYKEIEHLKTKQEIDSYLKSIKSKLNSDKHIKYIYQRAFFYRDIIIE